MSEVYFCVLFLSLLYMDIKASSIDTSPELYEMVINDEESWEGKYEFMKHDNVTYYCI